MTLVELLVVVLIIGLLAVVVLPTIGRSIDGRRSREAARSLSTFIARSQSRSLNAPASRGFILQPLPANPNAAIDIFFANAPEPYAGDLPLSRAHVVLQPPLHDPQIVNFITFGGAPDVGTRTRLSKPAFAVTGDTIQFGGCGSLFALILPTDVQVPCRISMSEVDGQNLRTLAWPRTDPTAGTTFAVHRRPRRASTGVLQLQRGAAIDVCWSCLGSQTLGWNGVVNDLTQPIAIMFDTAGKPLEIVHSGGLRVRIADPLYLLLGSTELCGNKFVPANGAASDDDPDNRQGANWQFADSVWVCIDNATSLVRTGPVDPRATSVFESQRFVRLTPGLGVTEQ